MTLSREYIQFNTGLVSKGDKCGCSPSQLQVKYVFSGQKKLLNQKCHSVNFCLLLLQVSIKAAVTESTISLMTMTTTQTALSTCCVSAPPTLPLPPPHQPLCLLLWKLSISNNVLSQRMKLNVKGERRDQPPITGEDWLYCVKVGLCVRCFSYIRPFSKKVMYNPMTSTIGLICWYY